jgi:large subunit ribosomal protein L15
MRLPKRGFNNPFGKDYAEVNLGLIQKFIDAGKLDAANDITEDTLRAAGLVRGGKDGVRLLGKGELSAKAKFIVTGATKGAVAAVEKAGGSVEVTAPTNLEVKAAKAEAKAAKGKKAK